MARCGKVSSVIPRSGRASERLEPVSGRTNGGVKCNGVELFDRAGVRRLHPSQGCNFLKFFDERKVSALALTFKSNPPDFSRPAPASA